MSAYRTSTPTLEEPDPFPNGPMTLTKLQARGGPLTTFGGYTYQVSVISVDEYRELLSDDWFMRIMRVEGKFHGVAATELRDLMLEEEYVGTQLLGTALNLVVLLKQ